MVDAFGTAVALGSGRDNPQQRTGDVPVISPEEVRALVRVAALEQDGVPFQTAAFTGPRRGELLALRWRDVDFAGSTIRVRASYSSGQLTTPKAGHVRAVPMASDVASALARLGRRESWIGEDNLIFSGRRAATSTLRFYRRYSRHPAGLGMDGTRERPGNESRIEPARLFVTVYKEVASDECICI